MSSEADVVGVTEQTHAVSPCDKELEDDNEDEPMVGPQRPSTLENIKKDSGGCDVVNRKELPTTTHIVERERSKTDTQPTSIIPASGQE